MAVFKRKRPNISDDHTLFLHNYVNKDLQSYFRVFNFFQEIIFCPKYRIKDNFITTTGWIAYSVSFIITFVNVVSTLFKGASGFNVNKFNSAKYNTIVYICLFFNCFVYSIGYITNFVVNFRKRHRNVALILKLQKISNVISEKSKRFKNSIRYNNFFNVFMILQHLIFSFGLNLLTDDSHKHDLLNDLLLMHFNFNMLYAIRVIVLLQNYASSLIELSQTKGLSLRRRELNCTRMLQAYRDLLDAYSIFIEVFQDLVTIFLIFLSLVLLTLRYDLSVLYPTA